MGLQKNTAGQKMRVFAFNRLTGAPVTGDAAQITCKVAKDWAAASALTDTNPTETEDGYYLFDLAQAETDADVLDFYPESSTGDVQVIAVPGTVYTSPPNFTALSIDGSGLVSLTAAAIAAIEAALINEGDATALLEAIVNKINTDLDVPALELAAIAAQVRAEMDSNSTQLAAIVADTNELQTDLTNGGRLDLLIDAIKAKTDLLTNLSVSGVVTGGTPSATSFIGSAGLSEVDDFYNGELLVFTSGALQGITRPITDYTGSTRLITVSPGFPIAPSDSDTFLIIGRA